MPLTRSSPTTKPSDTYKYTPEADFNGTVVIDFAVTDGNGATTIAAKTINITSINDAPALVDANALFLPNIQEDSSLTFSAQELLNAFYDADADPLSIPENSLSLLNTAQGRLTGNATEGWTFTPTADFNGEVTIEFTVSDGNTTDDVTHTVSFNVDAVNDDPTAPDWGPNGEAPLLGTITEDSSLSFTAAELLAGFTDVDNPTEHITITDINHDGPGELTGNATDGWTFTPEADFNGTINISYSVTDGNGGYGGNLQRIEVTSVNDT